MSVGESEVEAEVELVFEAELELDLAPGSAVAAADVEAGRGHARRGCGQGARRAPFGAAFLTALLTTAAVAGPVSGQGAEAVLGADSVRVGDVVPVGVSVTVAPTERVAWPDTLPLAGSPLENATRVRERVDTLSGGRLVRTGVYGVIPWRTGELALPAVAVRVVDVGGSPRTVRAAVPSLTVVSVLPPDTAGIRPRPARGVIGANWAWSTIALLVLALAAVVTGLIWWWRSRREEEVMVAPTPLIPPRERALAALAEARESGLLERGEVKEFYTRVSEAVRGYLAALDRSWGEDLTTTELLSRLRSRVGIADAVALGEILGPADQVKFARREPDRETALAEWEAAVSWVRELDWPPRPVATEEAA